MTNENEPDTPRQAAGYRGGFFTISFSSADTSDSPSSLMQSIGVLRRRNKKEMEKNKYQIKLKPILPKLLILIIAIAGVWGLVKIAQSPSEPLPGQAVEIQGNTHIAIGQSHPPYNSLPPTSGWHYASPAKWGIYEITIDDETQVHNLEHGGIMVQYRPGISKDALENLKRIVSGYASDVILAPYPNLDKNIALTAWGRVDKFDDFDEARIKRFINAFKDEGPEKISN